MRIIKLGVISLIAFFLLAVAMTSLLPSKITISRAIDIAGSTQKARLLVQDVNSWSQWMQQPDTSTKVEALSPNEVQIGRTKVIIVSASEEKISTEWRTASGASMQGDFNFITSKDSQFITIQWAFTYKVKWYPWEKLASILADKQLAPFMESSLDRLKHQLEHPSPGSDQ